MFWRAALFLLIFSISYLAFSPKPIIGIETGWDKLSHGLAFTVLALSGVLGFSSSRSGTIAVLCALLVYGGAIEIVQTYVPGRTAEWGDFVADVIGIGIGSWLSFSGLRFARKASAKNA